VPAVPAAVIFPHVGMLLDKGILNHTTLELVIPVLARIRERLVET
jgi:uncharacterized membrane protein YqaE (UPF0057 family)